MDIGDVCNAKLGSPYRRCRALFAEARADCSDLLGEFSFLCDIVDAFLPLCSVARGAFTDLTTTDCWFLYWFNKSVCFSRRALLHHPVLHRRPSEETSGSS